MENFDVGGGNFIFMKIGVESMKRKPKQLNDDID
ncbi:TPA: hypothetical protein QE959_002129 [Staphylococcus aureus]|nr:hypothetical protein [Staphylococcus aureus]HDF3555688.1 hypothetical protein [Staphylococcus aureus]HDT6952260.1 hypothetical protein [Staphylococcus aureus]HDT6957559.1 hypothetical protein [Staphylococcus aureus]HDT6962918.1 hypothetical protein [Staphylococcus aureus]